MGLKTKPFMNPLGPRGNICHSFYLVAFRKFTKKYASLPIVPIPYFPGREVGWSRMPPLLSNFIT